METIIKKDIKSNVTVIFLGLRILLPYLTVKSKLLCFDGAKENETCWLMSIFYFSSSGDKDSKM